MTNLQVADRYAKSLLDLALERNELPAIRRDVDTLLVMGQNRDLVNLLASPVVNAGKKKAILGELLAKAGTSTLTETFINVLITKGRESDLLGILGAWDRQYKEMNKTTTVTVTSAKPLTADNLAAIQRKLVAAGKTEADVDLHTKVNPKLLGGFILEFDGKVYDASVAHQLQQVRKELAG